MLLCSSISKTLDPGLRIGWVLPGRYRKQVQHLKLVTSMATATLPQLAVADYLEHGGYDKHLRTVRSNYRRNRDLCMEAIARYFPAETRATHPEGVPQLGGTASAVRLAVTLPAGDGTKHYHCTRSALFANTKIPKLHPFELWSGVGQANRAGVMYTGRADWKAGLILPTRSLSDCTSGLAAPLLWYNAANRPDR